MRPEPPDLLVGIKESDKALLQEELCIYPSMVFIYSQVKEQSRIISIYNHKMGQLTNVIISRSITKRLRKKAAKAS
jgi:hypothetical protein